MKTMTVDVFAKKVVVDPSREKLQEGDPPTELMWEPLDPNDTIEYIGFADPTGPGFAISTPAPEGGSVGPGVKWKAIDSNPIPQVFRYTAYLRRDGIVFSSDPEIVNEGQGGVEKEPDGGSSGGGSGSGGTSQGGQGAAKGGNKTE